MFLNRKIIFLSAIIFGLGTVAGFFAEKALSQKSASIYKIHPANQEFKFINPLVGFELAEGQNSFYELLPFRKKLEDLVNKAAKGGNTVSVYYRNMENGHWIGLNEDETYNPASLYKVPFMVAFLKAAEKNPSLLSKKMVFTTADAEKEKGKISAQTVGLVEGGSYSADDLLFKMIVESNNSAKSLLVKNTDLNYLRDTFEELGIPLFSEEYNKISSKKYSLFFRTLYNATFLNREMSEKALELLGRAEFEYGLRGGLPKNISIAHKFGDYAVQENGKITGFELHDCGIIYFPARPSFICVMTKGKDLQTLSKIIQEIARVAYEERGGGV